MNNCSFHHVGLFQTNLPGYVEEAGLEEEEEDHPLVVFVIDDIMILTRRHWSHSRVRLLQSNLVMVTYTILLLRCSKSVRIILKLSILIDLGGDTYLDEIENVE